jgi:hypothetical protein
MSMHNRSWQPKKPKRPPKPKVSDEVRQAVDAQAVPVVAALKKRFCKKPRDLQLNWPEDIFTRWHRDALYFVVVMRTPYENPPTFESQTARMDYAGDGRFNLGLPMRRGWNTVQRAATPEECLKTIRETVYL